MTTKFDSIRIIKLGCQRAVNGGLSGVQEKYLVALGLDGSVFVRPVSFHPSQ